jgi:molybdopterin-guanine dinucleotide biosynthesis protein MobB
LRRIHIIGRKNSGKTTLVVELVEELTRRGFSVGTIKHTSHRHELDTPGKDSHRHREAGARLVGVLSRNLAAVFRPLDREDQEVDPYEALSASFAECDLVLVEGDSSTAMTKVEVWRAAARHDPVAAEDGTIRAVITDDQPDVEVPLWPRSDRAALADRILELVGLSPAP